MTRPLLGTDFNFFRALKEIDNDPQHRELRRRNEKRLSLLHTSNRNYEHDLDRVVSNVAEVPRGV